MCVLDQKQANILGGGGVQPVVPTQITFTVDNADLDTGVYYADFNGTSIVVTATNATDAAQWTCTPDVGGDANGAIYTIDITNVATVLAQGATITVKASDTDLQDASVEIAVRPLVTALAFLDDHYAFTDGTGPYAINLSTLCSDAATRNVAAQVTTNPDTDNAYSHVTWAALDTGLLDVALVGVDDAGNQGTGNTSAKVKGLALATTQTVAITASTLAVANNTKSVTIAVRDPVTIATTTNGLGVQLQAFKFDGAGRFDVIQENDPQFNWSFPDTWTPVAAIYPQAYTANTAIATNGVNLQVTQVPTTDVTPQVRVSAYFVLASKALVIKTASLTASAAVATTATVGDAATIGDMALGTTPNEVMCNNPLLMFWEVSEDGATWLPLQVTANDVYVTAQAPVTATCAWQNNIITTTVFAYDSLLAMSCLAATGVAGGTTTVTDVLDKIGELFKLPGATDGTNANVKRLNRNPDGSKGASTVLGYWLNCQLGQEPAQTVNGRGAVNANGGGDMFSNYSGNIACGVWAQALMMMLALHGNDKAYWVQVTSAQPSMSFMVRNWAYTDLGNLSATSLTNNVQASPPALSTKTAMPDAGLAGQNNNAPPPRFGNHFIVYDDASKTFFDPSYGSVKLAQDDWITSSLAGLMGYTANILMAGYVTENVAMGNSIEPSTAIVTFEKWTGAWGPI